MTMIFDSFKWLIISSCNLFRDLRIKIIAIVSDECSRLDVFDLLDMIWFDEELRKQKGFEMRG
jgi:hypothetical protein